MPMTINDALHRLLLDNLTTATLLLNADLRLEYMNPAAEMLLAVSGQRSHGQFISELFTESTEALSALRQAVEHAHPFNKREAVLTALTGQTLTVDYAVTPILNRGETLLLLEVHPRDRLLRITKEEAQLSKQETTKMLVRGLAHEIKNPLGGIRGAAQLLARELPEESLKDYTNVIIEEADRLRWYLGGLPGPAPVVVGGDFNATWDHVRFRGLRGLGYTDSVSGGGDGWVPTWPVGGRIPAVIGIDHVLARGAVAVGETSTVRVGATDHRGVLATVRLPAARAP